jgi:vanillate O-demethylase ferredoxin subunit
MALRLARIGAEFEFHYCTRSPARTAFHDELRAAPFRDRVHVHFDDGPAEQRLDLRALLARRPDGAELYVCGPAGLMAAVVNAAEPAWPATHIHREYFSHDPKAGHDDDDAFRVRLARSGREFDIPGDQSIVEVLRAHGIEVPVSCEQGICGTCLTPLLDGTPDHRDLFMTDAEHAANDKITPCCSRAKSPLLVLDL